MEQGIYRFFNGTYIDLDRILEVGPLEARLHSNHFDASFGFSILYMFQEKERTFGFGLMNALGMARFSDLTDAFHRADDYRSRFDAAMIEVETNLRRHYDDLVAEWKFRKARKSALEQGEHA